MREMALECDTVAGEIVDWLAKRHDIERIEAVEAFPNWRSAKAYAAWLERDGAFSGAEDYILGLDPGLA
ncbi:MAG: hypothetical protein ACI8PZ_005213 [Myxococcota bacterium]|jgi:hypothetical protein